MHIKNMCYGLYPKGNIICFLYTDLGHPWTTISAHSYACAKVHTVSTKIRFIDCVGKPKIDLDVKTHQNWHFLYFFTT